MDNKATTKRMIGAVVLVLVAALLLAWLLKGKNRDGQQDMAMNQAGETKPILGFPGVGDDAQKPSIVGDDPNATQTAGIDVTQQQQAADPAQQATTGKDGAGVIPGVEVKLPETVANTTGFNVRPVGAGGEVRDLVDTDGKVKDGEGSMGTGDAKVSASKGADATQASAEQGSADKAQQVAIPIPAPESKTSTASASQQDKVSTQDAAPVEKKASAKVVLVNEKPVPRATSQDNAKAAADAAAAKVAAAKQAAEDKAAALAKAAAEKAAAAKSIALAAANKAGAAGDFVIQVLASSDKANADALAAPLKADGYNVAVAAATAGGKPIYRVNVGGFANRAAADAAQAKMKARYQQNQAVQGSFVTSSK